MSAKLIIPRGSRYGKFTVLCEVLSAQTGFACNPRRFLCQCDCGRQVIVRLGALTFGSTKSCGCWRKEVSVRLGQATKTHGYSKHKVYKLWFEILRRCYNPKCIRYKDYGGRGIEVCKSWRRNQMAFVKWALNHGWEKGLQIDRRNNNGNYTPRNCRFVTPKVQAMNRRKRNSNLRS
jgi:hypothetical protein